MPNPVGEVSKIIVPGNAVTIIVKEMIERIVFKTKFFTGTNQVNTGPWSAGLYELSMFEVEQLLQTKPVPKF